MYERITIAGKEYLLRFDINAVCDIEERAGVGIGALFDESRLGLSTARLFLWGGLKWRDRGITIERAGNLIRDFTNDGGSWAELMAIIRRGLEKAGVLRFIAPENAEDEEAEGDGGNPEAETA